MIPAAIAAMTTAPAAIPMINPVFGPSPVVFSEVFSVVLGASVAGTSAGFNVIKSPVPTIVMWPFFPSNPSGYAIMNCAASPFLFRANTRVFLLLILLSAI